MHPRQGDQSCSKDNACIAFHDLLQACEWQTLYIAINTTPYGVLICAVFRRYYLWRSIVLKLVKVAMVCRWAAYKTLLHLCVSTNFSSICMRHDKLYQLEIKYLINLRYSNFANLKCSARCGQVICTAWFDT